LSSPPSGGVPPVDADDLVFGIFCCYQLTCIAVT
jgi:hypothetical protein